MRRPPLCFCILLSEATPLQGSPPGPPNDTPSHPCLNTLLGTRLPLPCPHQARGSQQPRSAALSLHLLFCPADPLSLDRCPSTLRAIEPSPGSARVRAASGCSDRLSHHTGTRAPSPPRRTGTRAYRTNSSAEWNTWQVAPGECREPHNCCLGQLKDTPTGPSLRLGPRRCSRQQAVSNSRSRSALELTD